MTKEELLAENRMLRKLLQECEAQLQAIRDYIDFYSKKKEDNK